MNSWLKNFILMLLMFAASGLAVTLRPTQRLADQRAKMNLETMIPRAFGEWREIEQKSALIVDPGQAELIDKIYSQTLSRTYINPTGAAIMLSIAYGSNQNDGMALHYPEVCYPAQGFQVHSKESGVLKTSVGTIRVNRLITTLGDRSEPVTYWTTLGESVVLGGLDTRVTHLKYGMNGIIPDGMLVRFSSIDKDPEKAYALQAAFASDMVAAIDAESLPRFAGLNSALNSSTPSR